MLKSEVAFGDGAGTTSKRVVKIVNAQSGVLLGYINITTVDLLSEMKTSTHACFSLPPARTHVCASGDDSPRLVKRLVHKHI